MKRECIALAALLAACFPSPSFAAVTEPQIEAQISAQKDLSQGGVRAKIAGDHVAVSTYRNTNATDDDCKIQAALIAKTIMLDMGPVPFAVVTVRFYNQNDITHYKEVEIPLGSIKAFAGGDIEKSQFMSSVTVHNMTSDPLGSATNSLQASQYEARNFLVTRNGDQLLIDTTLPGRISDNDAKMLSVRMAEDALSYVTANEPKTVRVSFADPGNPQSARQVTYDIATLNALRNQLNAIFGPIALVQTAGSTTGGVAPGPMQEQRGNMLRRIDELKKNGGVSAYMSLFAEMERAATAGDENTVQKIYSQLDTVVTKQEATIAERGKTPKTVAPASSGPQLTDKYKVPMPGVSKFAFSAYAPPGGPDPNTIREQPEALLAQIEPRFGPQPDSQKKFAELLQFFAWTLRSEPFGDQTAMDRRIAAARRLELRWYRIVSVHPDWISRRR